MVVQELNRAKAKRTRVGDDKWYLVDKHDIDGQMNVAMSNVTNDVRGRMICCLAFK